MVLAVVDRVDADGVNPQLLEKTDIVAKSVEIEERVCGICCTTWLVGYTADVEAGIASPEGIASDLDLLLSECMRRDQEQYRSYRLH